MNSLEIVATFVILYKSVVSQQHDLHEKCLIKFDLGMCNIGHHLPQTKSPCSKAKICKKIFNITYIRKEPYNQLIVADLLARCCGDCIKVQFGKTFNKLSEITAQVMNTSHFVFPVLARASAVRLYGYYFIPVVKPPSLYFVTERDGELMLHLISACLEMWPLIIVVILMVAVAGFFSWILETWGNVEEFPRPFLEGWFEGFWWGFILITTVGYGDKVAKSIPAKCFSVFWIVIGITTFSIITAMFTSVVAGYNSPPPPCLSEMKVGALRHRIYDSSLIATTGGILIDIEHINIFDGIARLIQMMRRKEIDSFVLDRNTYLMFIYSSNRSDDVNYLMQKTLQTEKEHVGDNLFYGILVKSYDDYEYLVDYILDNLDIINTCNGLVINQYVGKVKSAHINHLFSSSGAYFWEWFTVLIIIILFICVFGIMYELCRRRYSTETETTEV